MRFPDKCVNIQGLPIAHFAGAPEMVKVAVVNARWHHPGLARLGAVEGNPGNAFLDGLQAAPGMVRPFGKQAERHLVRQDIVNLPEGGVVLTHMLQAVPLTDHGQDAQKMKDPGYGRATE